MDLLFALKFCIFALRKWRHPQESGMSPLFLVQKTHFWGQKISYLVFSRLNNRFLMLLILAPQIDIVARASRQNVNVC